MPGDKECSCCKRSLPIYYFSYSRTRNVYSSKCKECTKKNRLEYKGERDIVSKYFGFHNPGKKQTGWWKARGL